MEVRRTRFLFVGDTHGPQDLRKLSDALPALRLTARDAIVHCGDFGAPWAADDDGTLRWWRGLPCRVLICLGNHENYAWIGRQPLVRRFGCRGYGLGGNLFAPLAGETARVGGRSLWFYPGGFSVDFFLRVPGRTVFADELLPLDLAEEAVSRLGRRRRVGYVVSHDGPRRFVAERIGIPIEEPPAAYWRHLGLPEGSRAHPAFLLDRLLEHPESFGQWYFGHHHRDVSQGKLRCLWRQMALEDTRTGETAVIGQA